jgi:hypothetical protein
MAENEEKKNLFRNALGLTPAQGAGLGGAISATALIGSLLSMKPLKYENNIGNMYEVSEKRIGDIEKGLSANMVGYEAGEVGRTAQGLTARGITDTGVAKEATAQTRAGLSGAYAAAASALSQAKVNAKTKLAGAMSTYYQDLAQKQYKARMADYMGKMGIWGTLGGLGTGLIGKGE